MSVAILLFLNSIACNIGPWFVAWRDTGMDTVRKPMFATVRKLKTKKTTPCEYQESKKMRVTVELYYISSKLYVFTLYSTTPSSSWPHL